MATGLVARFRLAFTPGSQQQLEQEAKQAGKKTATAYEQGASGLQNFFSKIGGWLAAAFAVHKIVDFAQASIKAAQESETAWNELGFSLGKVGVNIDQVRGSLEKLGQRFLDTTTFGDEAALRGLNSLVQITGDYSLSLRAVQVSADLAAAKHLSLEDASVLVGRALEGNTIQLKRMGVEIKNGLPLLGQLETMFGGAAQNELTTYGGKLKQVGQFWQEFKEEIGKALVSAGGGTSVLDTMIGTLKGLASWVKQNAEQLRLFGTAIVQTADWLLRRLVPALQSAGDTFRSKFSAVLKSTADEIIFFLKAWSAYNKSLAPGASMEAALVLDQQIAKLEAFAASMQKAGDAARENLNMLGLPGGQGLGASLRGGGSRPSVGSGPDFTSANADRIAGDKAAAEAAAKEWKKMIDDLRKDYEAALRDAGQATLGLNQELDADFKEKSKARLLEIRTEGAARLSAMKETALKVLEIAGQEAEDNEQARADQQARDLEAQRMAEKRLMDLGDEAQAVANIATEALNLADQFGIVDDSLQGVLTSIQAIAQGISDVVQGMASGNPLQILGGAGSVVENLLGQGPGGSHDTAFQLEKLHQAALAGDPRALRTLMIYGNMDPSIPSPWIAHLDDQWGPIMAIGIENARDLAQDVLDRQAATKGSEQGKASDAARRAQEQAARDAAAREALDARNVEQQHRDFLGQVGENEREGLRLRDLAEEKQAQETLTGSAEGLSDALKMLVAQAVAAQQAAETIGETSVLGFDSPIFRDAKSRADRQFLEAQKAVADALAKQAEAAGISPDVEAGFTVQRTLTEVSAGRIVGELTSQTIWLEKIYNAVSGRTVWPLPGMNGGAGNIVLNLDGQEVARVVGAHQAGDYQLHASLAGSSNLPSV